MTGRGEVDAIFKFLFQFEIYNIYFSYNCGF